MRLAASLLFYLPAQDPSLDGVANKKQGSFVVVRCVVYELQFLPAARGIFDPVVASGFGMGILRRDGRYTIHLTIHYCVLAVRAI